MSQNYADKIAQMMQLRPAQVAATIDLLDSGNTLPFVARYRKEATGSLDEEQIRQLLESVTKLRAVDDRRETVIASIEEQGLLTPELRQQLEQVESLTELEDLYQPYRPKRRTRASDAREKGLEGLAELIAQQAKSHKSLAEIAAPFLSEAVPTVEDAFAGAQDIVAEQISDHPMIRGQVRQKALQWGVLIAERNPKTEDPQGVYALYYEFSGRVDRLKPYQVLAINRGEAEKVLKVKLDISERDWLQAVETVFRPNPYSPLAEPLRLATQDAAKRLLLPAIERDVRATLSEAAETHAIQVFGSNLRGLLNQPPLLGQVVMGVDPAYRTGCKIAVVDETGKVLTTTAIYPHKPQGEWQRSLQTLAQLCERYGVTLIAIGNGTASRETEQLVAELTRTREGLHYMMVNEAGASVYSASPEARAELPDLDVSLRGAVSIARRAQDPLAELVKIDPKAIGIGLYQHDVNQKQLAATLDGVVESVVNRVGVDLNTASSALLTYVAGIGPKVAKAIVEYRDESQGFASRADLKKVAGIGPKAFQQAAGFLRVREGENPLDASAIHPESYAIAKKLLQKVGLKLDTPHEERGPALIKLQVQPLEALAEELGTGVPTLSDIIEQLLRPGRDPREDLPAPILRSDVLSMDDLHEGLRLSGTVRNVVDFGAFVDIGVKQDGLLHISQIPRGQQLTVGDVIDVQILSVEIERGRIGLGWAD